MSATTIELSARRYSVTTADGVELSVREWGRRSAGTTVVLLHGHTLRTECWGFVRRELIGSGADVRVVAYDHRGHGKSGEGESSTYTVEQLARDLRTVLETAVPAGPVVLVGHSMGAMAILSYAAQFPLEIGSRISAVALISGAAGGLTATPLGRKLNNPVFQTLRHAALRAPGFMTRAKTLAARAAKKYSDQAAGPQIKSLTAALQNKTPIRTLAGFLGNFAKFDATDALEILGAVPTTVICGEEDTMTPVELSLSMASQIPGAQTSIVEGAGHGIIVERPVPVATAIVDLVEAVASAFTLRIAA